MIYTSICGQIWCIESMAAVILRSDVWQCHVTCKRTCYWLGYLLLRIHVGIGLELAGDMQISLISFTLPNDMNEYYITKWYEWILHYQMIWMNITLPNDMNEYYITKWYEWILHYQMIWMNITLPNDMNEYYITKWYEWILHYQMIWINIILPTDMNEYCCVMT